MTIVQPKLENLSTVNTTAKELRAWGKKVVKPNANVRQINEPEDIRDWNEGKIQIGVIHPASAGHGLNLQSGGSILVWFGLTWSLELYQQTIARLWRQGQTEKKLWWFSTL